MNMKRLISSLLFLNILFVFQFSLYAQDYNCQRYQLFETAHKYHNDKHKIFLIDTQTGKVWYLFISGGRYFWEPTKFIKESTEKEQ